jgi:hypothetical protein
MSKRMIGRRGSRLPAALALALALASGSALAQSADEEDLPLDTRLMRQLFKDLGLRRDADPGIEYRDRPPLVVPPSRALPPPQSESAVTSNPAWPHDPDAARRKADAERKLKQARSAAEAEIAAGRALSPAELKRGQLPAGATDSAAPAKSPEEGARPMRPAELGSKSLFSGMFSSFSNKPETAEFPGEPPRQDLTAPPPGYQTPSPDQPYGVTPGKEPSKPVKLEDRVTGPPR